ncbi:hypothetical protein E3Q12_02554 [Wallemia mellicola]|nr:hypothetical protein E3Q12_02554 [Wallemia mellicola]
MSGRDEGLSTSLGPQRRASRNAPSKPYERPAVQATPTRQPSTAGLMNSVRSLVAKPFSWLTGSKNTPQDEENAQPIDSPWNKSTTQARTLQPPPRAQQRPHTFYNDLPSSFVKSNHLTIPGSNNRESQTLSASYTPRLASSYNGRSRSPFTPVRHLMPGSPTASPRRSLLGSGRNASPLVPRTRYRAPTIGRRSPAPDSSVRSILSAAEDDDGDFNPYAHSRTGDKRSSFIEATPDRPSKRRATDAKKMVYNREADEFMSLEEAQARKHVPPAPKNEAERILLALEKMRTPLTDARKSNPLSARAPLPASQQSHSPLPAVSVPVPNLTNSKAKNNKLAPVNKKTEAMISPYARSKSRREEERRQRERDMKTSKLQEKLPKVQRPKNKIAVPSDDEDEETSGESKKSASVDVSKTSSSSQASSSTPPVATTSAAKLFAPISKDEFKPGERGQSATERARSSLRARTMTSSRQHSSAARKPGRAEESGEVDEEEEERKRQEERDALKSVPVVNFNFGNQATQTEAPKLNFKLPDEKKDEEQKPSTPKPAAFSFGESTTPKVPPPSSNLFAGLNKDNEKKPEENKPAAPATLSFSFGAPKAEKSEKEKDEEEKSKKAAAEKPNPFALFEANKKTPSEKDSSDSDKAAPSFSFNKPAEAPKPAFSFGGAPEKKEEEPKKEDKPAAATTPSFGGFSFSKPAEEEPKKAPTFGFGGVSKPVEEKKDVPPQPSLFDRLGGKPEEPKTQPSLFGKPAETPKKDTEAPKPAFGGFGGAFASKSDEDKSKATSPFSFGGTPFGASKLEDKPAEGEKKEDEKAPTAGGFSFGKPDEQKSTIGSSGSGFTFGAPKPVENGTSPFAFGQAKPVEEKKETPAFGQPAKAADEKPAFSFGAAPAGDANAEKPKVSSPFTFGTPTAPSGAAEAPKPAFGQPPSEPTKVSIVDYAEYLFNVDIQPSFGFGTPAATSTGETSKPPFAFGGSQSTLFGGASAAASPSTENKPGFSFGAPSAGASADKTPFAFGAGSGSTSAPAAESKPSTFAFGSANAGTNSPSTFQFGSGAGATGTAFGGPKPDQGAGGDSMEESPTRPAEPAPLFGAPAAAPSPSPFGAAPASSGFTFGASQPAAPAAPAAPSPAFGFGGGNTGASNGAPSFGGFGAAPTAPSSANTTAPTSPFAFGAPNPSAAAPNPSTPQQQPGSPNLFNMGSGSPAPGTPNSSRPVKPLRRTRR